MREPIRLSLVKAGAAGGKADPAGIVNETLVATDKRALLRVEPDGRIVEANVSASLMLGYDDAAFKERGIADIVIGMSPEFLALLVKLIPLQQPLIVEAVCVRSDGGWMSCEVEIPLLEPPWSAGRALCLWLKELRQDAGNVPAHVSGPHRARNNEMAELVAGQIAHDFNNLLTPLLAYPDLIRHEVGANETVGEYLATIEKAANDMSRLTQQLLSMARRGRVGSDVFSINDVIRQALIPIQSALPDGTVLSLALEDPLLSIMGSREQIRRVLENLVQNAMEAMAAGGTLGIRTENVYIDTPRGAYSALHVGEYVKLTVSDTGSGIPEDHLPRIFDPFFTTKKNSKRRGAGLGLCIVNGIVHDHRGYIDVESTPGKGTSLYLYFPVSRAPGCGATGVELPRGMERIMVVDDDAPQVQVLVSILQTLGYKVTGVTSGEQCLAAIQGEGRHVDLLVLDMVMDGGLDGLETFIEARKVVPGVRALLISGHAKATQRIARAQELGAGAYLRKPISIDSLARAVRDELDRERAVAAPLLPGEGARFLIADDDPMIRRLFSMIILQEYPKAMISAASNGKEAVSLFENNRHGLIIMDLQMPVESGRDAYLGIEELCRRHGWVSPKVVFCTGFSPPESLQTIIHGNPRLCLLRKPVNADILLGAIRRLAER